MHAHPVLKILTHTRAKAQQCAKLAEANAAKLAVENAKLLRVFKMGKQRKYLVLAPLAPITASRTSLQQPQPTPEYIVGRGGGWRWNTSNIIHISVY